MVLEKKNSRRSLVASLRIWHCRCCCKVRSLPWELLQAMGAARRKKKNTPPPQESLLFKETLREAVFAKANITLWSILSVLRQFYLKQSNYTDLCLECGVDKVFNRSPASLVCFGCSLDKDWPHCFC